MRNLEETLTQIIADRSRHGQLLAILAHLEYVGARKIAKSLPAQFAQVDHLEHLMEEARHASLLRRQAERLLQAPETGLEQASYGEAYLQEVDHEVDLFLRKNLGQYRPFECYLMVSLVIEERAMKFYPLYQRLIGEGTQEKGVKEALHEILADEVTHLEEMRQACAANIPKFENLVDRCREIEAQAFEKKFWPVISDLAQGQLRH